MQVSKEFLMEAVGLSLLVALLLVGVRMFQRTNSLISSLDRQQEQRLAKLEEYEVTCYDGLIVDGITAISYIKNVVGNYAIPALVETDGTSFKVVSRNEYVELRNQSSEYYIDAWDEFLCEVVRDENGSIECIQIKAVREGE